MGLTALMCKFRGISSAAARTTIEMDERDFAHVRERVFEVRERRLGVAKQPQSQWPALLASLLPVFRIRVALLHSRVTRFTHQSSCINDQMMVSLDGNLNVVADDAGTAAAGRHRAGIRIGQ